MHPDVTVCGYWDVKIQELTNYLTSYLPTYLPTCHHAS